ncbi:11-beta-hydroxysteroid dehydrogenase 1B-like protein [Cinnamomum micranthum f. kanehirae]|uniref:11-beta-hydroxysteroid dehydrogenase 1B-like protein n=1 Tax=Cinnamomum micranthum f. kanehirae TaxID=337451 RepID=A0A3S3MVL5_9MAGN|nr:11-beta-hydroxysteroid dehydrogenase 1B-like protein [Cinnamomum micranthum f. kanehirae]
MDVVHKFLSIAVPPFTILSLFLCLPSLYCFKLVLFFLRALFIEDMNGKVVLITGASSGIGEQLAYQYAKKGAFLALVARRENSLQEVGERARELGSPDVVVIRADVAKADECKRFVEQAVEHFGKLNHLVNNAGMASVCMFEEATDITKFTPVMNDCDSWRGWTESWMSKGKFLSKEGEMLVDQEIRDVFAPELLEWFYQIMLVTEPGTSQRDATTKKILDAKKYLYPDTIQSPEVKRD